MRLIDADALRQEIESKIYWGQVSKDNVESLDEIDDAPTVDAVPVVHGRWLKTQEPLSWTDVDCIECSNCHESWIIDEDCGFSDLADSWKYCTNCGAKMDGGNEE